jgi:hypothetical protein
MCLTSQIKIEKNEKKKDGFKKRSQNSKTKFLSVAPDFS